MLDNELARISRDVDHGIINLTDIKDLIRDYYGLIEKCRVMATEVETANAAMSKLSQRPIVLRLRQRLGDTPVKIEPDEENWDDD